MEQQGGLKQPLLGIMGFLTVLLLPLALLRGLRRAHLFPGLASWLCVAYRSWSSWLWSGRVTIRRLRQP